jgi:hypothetical protein
MYIAISIRLIANTLRVPCKVDGDETNQCTRKEHDGCCRFIVEMLVDTNDSIFDSAN